MRVLAIDTSTRRASVALLEGSELRGHLRLDPEGDHAQGLAPAVASLLPERGRELDLFALAIGPGSFTGLRIGLALVKGMALVHPRPVAAVSTLELLATAHGHGAAKGSRFLAVLDARAGEVYAGIFRALGEDAVEPDPSLPEGLYGARALLERLRAESPAGLVADPALVADFPSEWVRLESGPPVPDAHVLARIAVRRASEGRTSPAIDLEPAYLQRATPERLREAALQAGHKSVTGPTPSR